MINLYSNLPTLDLHGVDSVYAQILINDFIRDNYEIKNTKVIVIHGIGSGILRKTTQEVLKKNRYVEEYKLDNFNPGMTVVTIIKKP